jgi:hypothetical protein
MELNQKDWVKAETIARELAHDVDRNELGKIVAYAQRTRDTGKILALVERLPHSGYVRSGQTQGYLRRIATTLRRELTGLEGPRAHAILAWAFRLLSTYQTEQGTRTSNARGRR